MNQPEISMAKAYFLVTGNSPSKKGEIRLKCPLQRGRGGLSVSVNINESKFICFHCQNTGDETAQGGPVSFYSHMCQISPKEAFKALVEDNKPYCHITPPEMNEDDISEAQLSSVEIRNKFYSEFMKRLTLTDKHRDNLRNRGLSEDRIRESGYASVPETSPYKILKEISKTVSLEGIPGCYLNKKNYFSFSVFGPKESGILIPVKDVNGNIQALRVRRDKVSEDEPKYKWVSSSGRNRGTPTPAVIHVAKGNDKTMIITEGELKADIISNYTGCTVISVPGVGIQKDLKKNIEFIKKANKVYIAFDMDRYQNAAVLGSLNKLKELLQKNNIAFEDLVWDPDYKGFDDYLKFCEDNQINWRKLYNKNFSIKKGE